MIPYLINYLCTSLVAVGFMLLVFHGMFLLGAVMVVLGITIFIIHIKLIS